MEIGKIKDMLRDIIGRDVIQGHVMDFALSSGRREIEKTANFYWMRAAKTWNCVVNQQDYSITTSGSGGLNLPNFKDIHVLFSQISGSNQWTEVIPGDLFQLEQMYATTATGQPKFYIVNNTTLKVYPPEPEQTFPMSLWHFEWTVNPDNDNESDELTDRFPEALLFAGCVWGFTQVRKDEAKAQYYRDLLKLEIKKIQDLNLERMLSWRVDLVPRSGAGSGSLRGINANKSINPWQFSWY